MNEKAKAMARKYGSPGVGKSSIVARVAKELGREFIDIRMNEKAKAMHTVMLNEASIVGLPLFYKDDLLKHDLTCLCDMEERGLNKFWWRLRECGTQFSLHSEAYVRLWRLRECGTQFSSHSEAHVRLGWDNEQEHCYEGNLSEGTLRKLPRM